VKRPAAAAASLCVVKRAPPGAFRTLFSEHILQTFQHCEDRLAFELPEPLQKALDVDGSLDAPADENGRDRPCREAAQPLV
jgi:hypothetical protein